MLNYNSFENCSSIHTYRGKITKTKAIASNPHTSPNKIISLEPHKIGYCNFLFFNYLPYESKRVRRSVAVNNNYNSSQMKIIKTRYDSKKKKERKNREKTM